MRSQLTFPENSLLTTSTVKCVSPEPPPIFRIAACPLIIGSASNDRGSEYQHVNPRVVPAFVRDARMQMGVISDGQRHGTQSGCELVGRQERVSSGQLSPKRPDVGKNILRLQVSLAFSYIRRSIGPASSLTGIAGLDDFRPTLKCRR